MGNDLLFLMSECQVELNRIDPELMRALKLEYIDLIAAAEQLAIANPISVKEALAIVVQQAQDRYRILRNPLPEPAMTNWFKALGETYQPPQPRELRIRRLGDVVQTTQYLPMGDTSDPVVQQRAELEAMSTQMGKRLTEALVGMERSMMAQFMFPTNFPQNQIMSMPSIEPSTLRKDPPTPPPGAEGRRGTPARAPETVAPS